MENRWSALTPDAHNVTPLYLQLARNLATAIHCGVWSAGEALPSERSLSDAIGVSRITARKAIALLVEQGLIRRARGAGSFITPRVEDPLSRLTGFTKKMEQRGFRPDSIWLERELRSATRDEIVHLGLSPGASVASLRRLRRADGIVMAVEHSSLPVSIVSDPQAIGGSLYSYLEQRGMPVVRALQHFRAVNASSEIAALMDIEQGCALLLITRVGYSADQRAIELTDTYCRDDYYDFVAELRL
ncbi:putative transcriptional regulator of N-Acetylglucosamine utilization, GntR family [Paraburkholderia caribensis MBA4]|uniref:Putative transcriptional regulator of N-Acetylglucosamine utilization, GntR family n=1 Tax=Paraburkholderia caribensis MBA4 TaxID=1323664 RepID=A0A0P0R610_9BURK|nr:GntR family transcriptional regulator [Paraburkholderia caribensis]ALL63179.1 putative transcriptional regulator of N-Acetylglucosamine utilization, GntR family [Paraburkholderia caribensis MBA4]